MEDSTSRGVAPNAFYIPSPVVLMGTRSRDGTPDIATMSAVGVLCLDPPIVGIGMKPSRRTYKNVVESREFTLSLPTESQIDAVDFVGTRKLRNVPDKIDRSGLELRSMTEVDSPAVVGCPIVMACRLLDILDRHSLPTLSGGTMSHHVVLGQLVECRVDTTWIRDNEVRIEEVPSLIYLNRYYAALGERLAVQRFTDDDSVRDAKMEAYRRI